MFVARVARIVTRIVDLVVMAGNTGLFSVIEMFEGHRQQLGIAHHCRAVQYCKERDGAREQD